MSFGYVLIASWKVGETNRRIRDYGSFSLREKFFTLSDNNLFMKLEKKKVKTSSGRNNINAVSVCTANSVGTYSTFSSFGLLLYINNMCRAPSTLFDNIISLYFVLNVAFVFLFSSSPRQKSHSHGSERIVRPLCKVETHTGHR